MVVDLGFVLCAPEGIRTPNLLIRSQMLYPLSYGRVARGARASDTLACAPRGHEIGRMCPLPPRSEGGGLLPTSFARRRLSPAILRSESGENRVRGGSSK